MPARIDHPAVREQVRTAYYANGRNLTAAAQACGIPVDRAEKWKERGHWDKLTDAIASQSSVSERVGQGNASLAKTTQDLARQARHRIARVTMQSVKRAKPVPIRTMRDLRDAGAVLESVDPIARDGREGAITLNVLNVGGSVGVAVGE